MRSTVFFFVCRWFCISGATPTNNTTHTTLCCFVAFAFLHSSKIRTVCPLRVIERSKTTNLGGIRNSMPVLLCSMSHADTMHAEGANTRATHHHTTHTHTCKRYTRARIQAGTHPYASTRNKLRKQSHAPLHKHTYTYTC